MGADIVVGSYTGRRLHTQEELKSMSAILAEIASFTGLYDAEVQKEKVDLLIEHDFGAIIPVDFYLTDSLISIGHRSALNHIERLDSLADTINQF